VALRTIIRQRFSPGRDWSLPPRVEAHGAGMSGSEWGQYASRLEAHANRAVFAMIMRSPPAAIWRRRPHISAGGFENVSGIPGLRVAVAPWLCGSLVSARDRALGCRPVVVLITWLRLPAFIALLTGRCRGLGARMPLADIRAFQQGGRHARVLALVIGWARDRQAAR
jgi:hypothetical protein